jgi:gamma-glutamyltranspeptidase/glutathione hydrolase
MGTTLDQIRQDLNVPSTYQGSIPLDSALSITTPGAAAGLVDTVETFGSGKLSLEEILGPAIKLAEEGFPVSEIASHKVCWCACLKVFRMRYRANQGFIPVEIERRYDSKRLP